MKKGAAFALVLTALYLLHNDFWLWWRHDPVLGGIPIGLAYHIGYCLLISTVWAFVLRRFGTKGPTDS